MTTGNICSEFKDLGLSGILKVLGASFASGEWALQEWEGYFVVASESFA